MRTDTKIKNNMDFGLGSLVGGGMQMLGAYQNFKYQQKLMEQQNQYNVDMWKMQAEYNSPQAQMQRYSQAGLNPNLIYGQGSSGNMSSAPVQGVPDAPNYSEGLGQMGEGIGKLFNIENLRTLRANRKKAEEDARLARLNRFDKEDEREAINSLGLLYDYDSATGRYVFSNGGVEAVGENPRGSNYGDVFTRQGRLLRLLSDNVKNTALIMPRSNLYSAQRSYLMPQIAMANYERKYQPYSFWIGQGSKVLNALPLPSFKFSKHFGKPNTLIQNSKRYEFNY